MIPPALCCVFSKQTLEATFVWDAATVDLCITTGPSMLTRAESSSRKWKRKKTFMAPRHQNCTPLLQQLHWLPISEQIKYKTACMCYNAITGSAPSYLFELLHLYSHSRSLCSSSDTCMLKIQRFNCKTHGFHTFSHFGPHIRNNLPRDIRHSATISSFKSKLNTFFFSEY